MGIVRELAGLARDGFDPRASNEERTDGRRHFLTKLTLQATPGWLDASAFARPEGDLFPKSFAAIAPDQRFDEVLVLLSTSPGSAADPTPSGEGDVLDLRSGAPMPQPGAVLPRDWNAAQRLISVVNAGLLERYRRITVVQEGDGSTRSADLRRDDPWDGGRARASAAPSDAARTAADQILARLRWPTLADELTAPTSLDFTCRAFILQGLVALRLAPEELAGPSGEATLRTLVAGLAVEGRAPLTTEAAHRAHRSLATPRIIPFYLPQYHPTSDNDAWWGKGFTEWTNVSKARPSFRGHRQPKLPQDLGFYDLRLDETREAQAALARGAGVAGFMYYHYWFAGDRLLDIPLDRHRAQPDLDLPFCLMWANENWTRSWDGDLSAVLKAQDYDRVPAEQFIVDALPILRDPRYLSVGDKRILAVYRPTSIPGFARVADAWRARAAAEGLELFLLGVEYEHLVGDVREALDGTMAFPPHRKRYERVNTSRMIVRRGFQGGIFSYSAMADADIAALPHQAHDHYPGVMTSWDNTPRRGLKGHVWVGSNPYTFRRWLLSAAESVEAREPDERIVFVNAWNEWAEGAMLEPNTDSGSSYLDAVRDITG